MSALYRRRGVQGSNFVKYSRVETSLSMVKSGRRDVNLREIKIQRSGSYCVRTYHLALSTSILILQEKAADFLLTDKSRQHPSFDAPSSAWR